MRIRTKIIPFLLLFMFFANVGAKYPVDEIPRDIAIAFKVGTAKELARFFNDNLELTIEGKEDVYSKSQAERIVDDFFTKYPPKSFEFIHEGGRSDAQYAIGKLVTFNGNFRVYMYLKKGNGKLLIHRLRIEKENV